MKRAALGFRAHSGWTALVALCLERNQPRVLARQRPKLVEKFTYKLRQPYHTAGKMPFNQAAEFVADIEASATRLAEEAIRNTQAELRSNGYELTCFGLPLASARPLPGLENILASHALVHTADGELFRRALIHAGECCQMTAFTLADRELVTTACQTLEIGKEELLRRITALGRPLGPPWSQDEKFAALAAWMALRSG